MSTAQAAWLQAYATILAGLLVGVNSPNFPIIRDMARKETDEACAMLGVSVP